MMTETNRIEFKRELTRDLDLEREVVAFLNYREGGMIYFGIDDNGKAVGVKDIDGDMLKIKDRIRTGISPSPMGLFDVKVEHIDNVPVIKVFISSGSEKPYYKTRYGLSEKGCFMRVGTAAEPMTSAQIEDLYARRVHNSLKNVVSPRQDLTFAQLKIYYTEKGFQLNDNFIRSLDLMTDDGKYNYVAYLLADENGNSMKLAKYSGTDRYNLISNNEYGYCCLITATQKVLDKLDVENKVSSVITSTRRIDTPQWDKIAVREAVINAVVHNDYYYGAPSKIELFSDRMEITSIGKIPLGLSKDDFFNGVSLPRNRELMRVFRDVEMVEALGSGMNRIMRTYGRDNFEFGNNYIRMIVPYNWIPEKEEPHNEDIIANDPKNVQRNIVGTENTIVENGDGIVEKQKSIVENIAEELPETQLRILQIMKEKSDVSAKLIAEEIGIAPRNVQVHIQKLKLSGLIRRVGPDKGGHWEVVDTKEVGGERGTVDLQRQLPKGGE